MSKEDKRVIISTTGKCDYCEEPFKFAGATPNNLKVFRSCQKHLKKAQKDIKKATKDENNKA
jgi:hypothetical protein